jgi:hypothetical protein
MPQLLLSPCSHYVLQETSKQKLFADSSISPSQATMPSGGVLPSHPLLESAPDCGQWRPFRRPPRGGAPRIREWAWTLWRAGKYDGRRAFDGEVDQDETVREPENWPCKISVIVGWILLLKPFFSTNLCTSHSSDWLG